MLEHLKEVIVNLEKSLNMLVQDRDIELLQHPEYLEAMKELVQSIHQVTQTLKNLEASYTEGREQDRAQRMASDPSSEVAEPRPRMVEKKSKDHRIS